jgi:hypothetical protein
METRAWTYLAKCKHITDKNLGDGFPAYNVLRALQMVAKENPTNSLDELERWVGEQPLMIHTNNLLAKIQELKQTK